ncbi:Bestrophin, RFP-TM, chloride channel-domain-containing protein [Mycena leptocephala]|nr:Bestrophin, RFP-TM, chloride channel-domain-containing protein [Mycena leptocephala]
MVASNPLFRGGFTMRKFNATVINDIWLKWRFSRWYLGACTLSSIILRVLLCISGGHHHRKEIHNLAVNSSLLTVLGTVLGLVISFRTSSAYERYQEGRKMWTNISIASRNLAQIIWIHVAIERTDKDKNKMTTVQSIIEKKSMINLHFLRGETGVYYEDLYPLICFLPATPTPTQNTPSHARPPPPRALERPTLRPPSLLSSMDSKSEKSWFRSMTGRRNMSRSNSTKGGVQRDAMGRKIKPSFTESNVPLEITIYLNRSARLLPTQTIAHNLLRNGYLQPALATGLMNNIASLQDTLSNLDRIGNTPLPFAYQAHLRMSLWLYLLLLPFQIVSFLHYLIIPGTAFASFLLLGFLEIGQEIENPFNYDENDLDLDQFCMAIQRELHEVTAHTMPDPSAFVFTSWNQPLAPADRRNAEELTLSADQEYKSSADADVQPGMASIRRTLLKNWRDVERITRHH